LERGAWIPRPLYRRLKRAGLTPLPHRYGVNLYSYDLRKFLYEIGGDPDNYQKSISAVTFFMLTKDARRMPRSLRRALIARDLLNTYVSASMSAYPDTCHDQPPDHAA